jgi:protein-S-isoprenylcysteine O-methyltransferase Ste14
MTCESIVNGCWAAIIVYWLVSAITVRKPSQKSAWFIWWVTRVVAIGLILVLAHHAHARHVLARLEHRLVSSSPIVHGLGAALCVAGVALAIWARRRIGRNWGAPMSLRVDHELVTDGPYRFVRHPIYTGLLLAMLGSALAGQLWWAAILIVSTVYFGASALIEERMMGRLFPLEYPQYRKRTKMLIPFLW